MQDVNEVFPVYVTSDPTEGRGPMHVKYLFADKVEAEKMVGMLPPCSMSADGVPRESHSGARVGPAMLIFDRADTVPEYQKNRDELELRGKSPEEIERRRKVALAKLDPQERKLLGL